jgi:N-acetylglutamate synthase-like GNAT family acetyltransferase
MKGGKSRIKGIDDYWAEIKVYSGKTIIGKVGFTMSRIQIMVDTLVIYENHKRKGYGTLLIDFIKGISRMMKRPIIIFSLTEAVEFYEKMGFKKINEVRKNKVYNLILTYECDEEPVIDDLNLIWIPENIRKKKDLRISL